MLFAKPNAKVAHCSASHAETKRDLKAGLIPQRELALSMTKTGILLTKVMGEQSVGVGKARSITQRMRMLSFVSKTLKNFSQNLGLGLMAAQLIGLIRLAIMNLETCGGQRFWSKRRIVCPEIIGSHHQW
jgi:hypothetical protein